MLSENANSFTSGLTCEFNNNNNNNNIKWDEVKFLQIRYTDVPGRFLASYILKDSDDDNLEKESD
jgi:hypothetical protein